MALVRQILISLACVLSALGAGAATLNDCLGWGAGGKMSCSTTPTVVSPWLHRVPGPTCASPDTTYEGDAILGWAMCYQAQITPASCGVTATNVGAEDTTWASSYGYSRFEFRTFRVQFRKPVTYQACRINQGAWSYWNVSTHVYGSRSATCGADWMLELNDPASHFCYQPQPIDDRTCSVGNPVAPATGAKLHAESDYAGIGADPLSFDRLYRSLWPYGARSGSFGATWFHSFDRRLVRTRFDSTHAVLRIVRPDSSMAVFTLDPASPQSAATWVPATTKDRVTQTGPRDAPTGYVYEVFETDAIETFDGSGRLLSIRQRNGWTTTLVYSDAATPVSTYLVSATTPLPGLLTTITNAFGRSLRLVYDANGQLVQLLPPGAAKDVPAGQMNSPIRYAYAEPASLGAGVVPSGQLTSVTWQDGATRRYHYEDNRFPGALSGITDEAGVRIATYRYNSAGRVYEEFKAGGVDRLTFMYSGDYTYVTDYSGPNGAAVQRTYQFQNLRGVALPVAVSAPCRLCGNTKRSSTYDVAGNLTKSVDHDGSVTFYAYDAKGRETERASFPGSYQSASTRPALNLAEKVTSTQWHPTFNLPTQVAEPGKVATNSYNGEGMLIGQSWTATTDPTGASAFNAIPSGSTYSTGWSNGTNSLPTTVVTQETAAGVTMETGRWTFVYKTNGSVERVTDVATGSSATLSSDASGLVTRIDASNGAFATFTPNARGRMIKAVTPGVTIDFSVDARGLPNEIRFSDGRWIQYTHNAAQRLIKIVDNTGQVEQYAGIEPRWFFDETTVRTAAAWLYLRGKRFGSLLVSEARAQAAVVVVPAVIVLGLFIIVESGRRNGAGGGDRCCGQDGPVGTGGGGEDAKESWLRQIAVLLSGQTAQPPATPAPIYDKAGLLVSPQACKPPPGNCDPNRHKQLQDEVDARCSVPRACVGGMPRSELLASLDKQRACAIARDKINKTCFAGGDVDHRNQAIDAWRGVTRCEYWLGQP